MCRYGLLPSLAATLRDLAKASVNDRRRRERLAAGLRELIAADTEAADEAGLACSPLEAIVPRSAVAALCAFLAGGAKIGLSGCVRGDLSTTHKVRVTLALQWEVPLSLSFRSALAQALVAVLGDPDADGRQGSPHASVQQISVSLSDVVIPADAYQLVDSVYAPHSEGGRQHCSAGRPQHWALTASIPVRDEALGAVLAARLKRRLATADQATRRLQSHLARLLSSQPLFACAHAPEVSVVAEAGKVPTPIESVRRAGADSLEADERRRLLAECFTIDLQFGEAATASSLLIYLQLLFPHVLQKQSLLGLHGLRLENVELHDIPLELSWRDVPASARAAGRLGTLEVDVALLFKRATVQLQLSSQGSVVLPKTDMPLTFTGGRLQLQLRLHVEGGRRMCQPGCVSSLPSHVVEYGPGVYLQVAQCAPQFQGFSLTRASKEQWRRTLRVFNIVDLALVVPVRKVLSTASSFWALGRDLYTEGARQLYADQKCRARVWERWSSPSTSSEQQQQQQLASSDFVSLILKTLVSEPAEKVVGMPLVSHVHMESAYLKYFNVALERQRARRAEAAEEAAAEAEASAPAASVDSEPNERGLGETRARAISSLHRELQGGWFAPATADGVGAALASCRAKGVDEASLETAKARLHELLGKEVAKRAVGSAISAFVEAKKAEDERLASEKAATDVAAADRDKALGALRNALTDGWFAPATADGIGAALASCRAKGVDEASLETAKARLHELLGKEVAKWAVGSAISAFVEAKKAGTATDVATTERVAVAQTPGRVNAREPDSPDMMSPGM